MCAKHKVLSLGTQITIVVAASSILFLLAMTLVARNFIRNHFGDLERESVTANFRQAQQEIQSLSQADLDKAQEWGERQDQSRIREPQTIFLVFDSSGTPIHQSCPGLSTDSRFLCPSAWVEDLRRLSSWWHSRELLSASGVVSFHGQFYTMALAAFRQSDKSQGYVLLGRRLKQEDLVVPGKLGRAWLRPLSLVDKDRENTVDLQRVGEDSLDGQIDLPRIPAVTGAQLCARLPRITIQEGRTGLFYLWGWMTLLGVSTMGVLLYFLYRRIGKRLQALHSDLHKILIQGQKTRICSLGQDEIGQLAVLVNHALHLLEETRQEYQSRHLQDPATQFSSRHVFLDELKVYLDKAAMEEERNFSVMLIALDRFQKICDSYGTQAGDLVLRKEAERLRKFHNHLGHYARTALDCLAVILYQTEDVSTLARTADNLRQALEVP
ncbi:MAG TPA: GGDEF domain-containing protein, partial [Fibrobacteraceae bacterium]|nr:GGDEF domain-containing protein [Fibrobacteraceae bacterium]